MEDEDVIAIPPFNLGWTAWFDWNSVKADTRWGGVKVPNGQPGVYEAKYPETEERLTIGKASDLRMRIKQGLLRGKVPHSAGTRIRANEEVDRVVLRWAATDRPSAAEEELHRRHRARF